MTDDPFRAPKARLSDADTGPDLAARPASVTLACRLLWATLIIGALSMIPGVRTGLWSGVGENAGAGAFALGFIVAMTVLEAWLIRLVSHGRGWARWLLLAYLLAGWLMTFSDFSATIDQGMVAVIVDLVSGVAEMIAIGLLFLGRGRAWYCKDSGDR